MILVGGVANMPQVSHKIIFLDVDGVLNGGGVYATICDIMFEVASRTNWKWLKRLYKKHFKPYELHASKLRRLNKIVEKTGAKIVVSSSWRNATQPYEELIQTLSKYGIKVIGKTDNLPNATRGNEIFKWLIDNYVTPHLISPDRLAQTPISEVAHLNFIILDDEVSDLKLFENDERFICTNELKTKEGDGRYYQYTGLKRKHVKRAIKILGKRK